MIKTKLTSQALFFFFFSFIFAGGYEEVFRPRPGQSKIRYQINKDYTQIPYVDKLGDSKAGFTVHEVVLDEGTAAEWDDIEREFLAESIYNILIPGNNSTVVVEHIYNVGKNTSAMLNYHCENRNQRACMIGVEIFDPKHQIIYRSEPKTSGAVRIDFKAKGDIYFRFINKETPPSRVLFGIDCKYCGAFRESFITKKTIRKKVKKIQSLSRFIGELMILTSNTKKTAFEFSDNVSNAEGRLYFFSSLEIAALFGICLWQIKYMKGLLSKRRVI